MSTLRELFDAIRAAPDDDGPRLVAADYYEEHGDPARARLIRLQLQRAALDPWHARCVSLELDERALLAEHGARWRKVLPDRKGVLWGRFERGFISKAAFDDITVLRKNVRVCQQHAPLAHVVTHWPRLRKGMRRLAVIDGLTELTLLGTVMDPKDVEWLARSPILSTLRALNLVESRIDPAAFAALLASPHLEQLQALRLPRHELGNAGVAHLVAAALPALVELDLSVATQEELGSGGRDTPTMDAAAAAQLAAWPQLGRIHTLNLTGNQCGPQGLATLLSSPRIRKLKHLDLRSVSDYDWQTDERLDTLAAFAEAHDRLRLTSLDIGENLISQTGCDVLVGSPALSRLQVLRMDLCHEDWNRKTDVTALLDADWWDTLRVFSAHDTTVGKALFPGLVDRDPRRIHTLRLGSPYFYKRLEQVADTLGSRPLRALLSLGIDHVAAEELDDIGALTSMPRLLELQLGADEPENPEAFLDSPLGSRLRSIDFWDYWEPAPALSRLPRPEPVRLTSGTYTGPLREL